MVYINSLSYIRRMLKENPLGCSFYIRYNKEDMFNSYLVNNSIPFLIFEREHSYTMYFIADKIDDLIRYAYNKVNHVGDGKIKNTIRS